MEQSISPLRRHARTVSGRRDGAILIIALGVLTLLSILGATFFSLMRLEKEAAANYVESQQMDMLTQSALDQVIAQLHDATNRRSWTFFGNTPWLHLVRDEGALAHGRLDVESDRVGQWQTYSDLGGKLYRFKTKVIDTAAQINLNGRQDTLARMLDNLGEAIARSPRLERDAQGDAVTNPFYEAPNRAGRRIRGQDILMLRQRLEGQRFTSKAQLKQLIGEENFEVVKDFVTCYSWEDPYTYRADDGQNEVPDLALGLTGFGAAGGAGGAGGGQVMRQPPAHGAARLAHEPRYPININTAPEEVLIACLWGLAGRRIFPYSRLGVAGGGYQGIDQNAQILGERVIGQEEVRDVAPRGVFVYSALLEYDVARKLAQEIIRQRKDPRGFFRAWRTNDPSQPGFEDFVDQLDSSFFPPPTSARVVDPDQPQNTQLRGHIIGGGATPIGRLWVKGNAQGPVRSVYKALALPVHESHSWYYEMMKGILKANFNPNTRINRYNPNSPAYVPVDKSDLVWWDYTTRQQKKGHTTEFTFDPNGIFEITTLSELVDTSKLRRQGSRTVATSAAGRVAGPVPYRRKMRTVVKVYDVLRHTSQFHFAKSFDAGTHSSKRDRKFTCTWPEPLNALTELYSQGSHRDGRVELLGFLDAVRDQIPFNNRDQAYGKNPAIVMEMGLYDLPKRSQNQLRTALKGGGTSFFGDEVTNALRDAFNANYSRTQSTFRDMYRVAELSALGVFTNKDARYIDPFIGREVLGTDLYPDGFHSSIVRMPHLSNRVIALPARQRLGEASPGGGNSRVGASGLGTRGQNLVGNVPYYTGGIAFWVKFEFDGDDPVFSGLIGCTQVIREVLPAAQEFSGSEGTQFFVFKNTQGQLRIVRMYYHQAFPEMGGEGGGESGAINLFPDPGSMDEDAGAAAVQNPILEHLDPKKWISRSDILVDVRHFRAHEWHHVAVEWNDQNPVFPIRLFLDFKEVRQGGTPRRAQQLNDGTANSWVRLNERQPRDGLLIGGIIRQQGVADAGVFKWFTTTSATGTGGVNVVSPSVKRILANATIDEIITYDGQFASAKTYYGGGTTLPGYFTNQTGEYANEFDLPLPPDVDRVMLRSIDWTSYYPTTYTDSLPSSFPQRLSVQPMMCDVAFTAVSGMPASFSEPWRRPSVTNPIAGREAFRRKTKIRGENLKFVYKFRMRGARYTSQGNTSGGVVQTPVLDDVTLTYFLPSPKILHQEEID